MWLLGELAPPLIPPVLFIPGLAELVEPLVITVEPGMPVPFVPVLAEPIEFVPFMPPFAVPFIELVPAVPLEVAPIVLVPEVPPAAEPPAD